MNRRKPRILILTHDASWAYELAAVLSEFAEVETLTADDEAAVIDAARGVSAIVVTGLSQRALFRENVVGQLKHTRFLFVTGVGTDGIDLDALTAKGILVCNNPDFCTSEVAEHTLALVLTLWRKVIAANAAIHAGAFPAGTEFRPIYRLAGRTVGIVGFGRIGQAVAARFQAFDTRVVAYDHHAALKQDLFQRKRVESSALPDLLAQADIVSLHVPLTPQTRHIIGETQLRMMKPSAILVNTSRGAVVDETALTAALKEKRLGGACLDVFAQEPLPADSPLRKLDSVILTPHLGSTSEEAVSLRDFAQEVRRVMAGKVPRNPVHAQPGTSASESMSVRRAESCLR